MAESKTKAKAPKSTAAKPVAEQRTVATAEKPASPRKVAAEKKTTYVPDAEERYRMIQVAAYYLAERHDFIGNAEEFWLQAEAQIDQILSK